VSLDGLSLQLDTGSFLQDDGQRAALCVLAGMLGSFAFIRFSTRMIRAQVSWWPGNIEVGDGLHIHHLVFGIVLLMVAGFIQFGVQPATSPWIEIVAVLFGIGVGLTLDEYALWLHLEDVYWAEEGRQSVDAVIFASILGAGFLVGTVPLGADDGGSTVALIVTVVANLAFCVAAALKGKYTMAIVGMLIPMVAWIGAIRVARPGSYWARRRYEPNSSRLARGEAREGRRHRRRTRLQNLIGGHPSESR
jgi:lysyl-tRNA synthetase, class II